MTLGRSRRRARLVVSGLIIVTGPGFLRLIRARVTGVAVGPTQEADYSPADRDCSRDAQYDDKHFPGVIDHQTMMGART